jgi:hypothetical protein
MNKNFLRTGSLLVLFVSAAPMLFAQSASAQGRKQNTSTQVASREITCITGGVTQNYQNCPTITFIKPSSTDWVSVRSNPAHGGFQGKAATPIDVPRSSTLMACRYVDNISSDAFFVPFQTPAEWGAFLGKWEYDKAHGLANPADLQFCARQTKDVVVPDEDCPDPEPGSVSFNLPYGRVTSTYPDGGLSTVFKCNAGKSFEVVKILWEATASDDLPPTSKYPLWPYDTSGWERKHESFSPGGCGAANGVEVMSAPTKKLCEGDETTQSKVVTGETSFTWACSAKGTDGSASTIACSAPKKECAECEEDGDEPVCGKAASQDDLYSKPKDDLCAVGKATPVSEGTHANDGTGQYYYSWQCKQGSKSVTCKAASCACAMCGDATHNAASSSPPSGGLCLSGKPRAGYGTYNSYFQVVTSNPRSTSAKSWWKWACDIPTNDHECYAPRK